MCKDYPHPCALFPASPNRQEKGRERRPKPGIIIAMSQPRRARARSTEKKPQTQTQRGTKSVPKTEEQDGRRSRSRHGARDEEKRQKRKRKEVEMKRGFRKRKTRGRQSRKKRET